MNCNYWGVNVQPPTPSVTAMSGLLVEIESFS